MIYNIFKRQVLLIISCLSFAIAFSQDENVKGETLCCGFPIYSVAVNPNIQFGNDIASTFGCSIKLWTIYESKFLESTVLSGHSDDVTSLSYSPDGNLLASGSKDNHIKIWDLILRKEKYSLEAHNSWVKQVSFSHNGKMLASCGRDGKVLIWDAETGKIVKQMVEDSVSANAIAFDASDTLLAVGFSDGKIKVFNLFQSKIVEYRIHQHAVNSLIFIDKSKLIASGGNDHVIQIYDIENRTTAAKLIGHELPVNALLVKKDSLSNLFLFSASDDETVRSWSLKNYKEEGKSKQKGKIYSLFSVTNISNPYSNLIISGSENKKIDFYKENKLQAVAELASVGKDQAILKTPENYFYSSSPASSSSEYVAFVKTGESIPDEYLEIKYNRPDIVLKALGLNFEKMEVFKKAYYKRLKKLGLDSTMFVSNVFPTMTLLNRDTIPFTVNNKKIRLHIKGESKKSFFRRIVVKVNGVPEIIKLKNVFYYDTVVNVVLSKGRNLVELYSVNDVGANSNNIQSNIYSNEEKTNANLYVVSIGVSKYKDQARNLSFASSDAQKFIDAFKTAAEFKNIYTYTFIDSLVTKSNVLSLKAVLSKSTVDDEVIVFYSGHGLLSDSFDYYLATPSTTFDKPEDGGLPFDSLENLLQSIPARKRLMLLDASWSGEIDKDELRLKYKVRIKPDTIQLRGLIVRDFFNPFQLLKEYFADNNNKSGIFLISAAGGSQYVIERNDMQSGIFTYSLLNALKDSKTDTNNDGELSFRELFTNVSREVILLTRGSQQPEAIGPSSKDVNLLHVAQNADNKPPVIQIIEPETKARGTELTVLSSGILKLKGVVFDESDVKYVMINGVKARLEKNLFQTEITLQEGENNIVIAAEDIYSNKINMILPIYGEKAPITKFGKYYAMIIAVDNYKNNSVVSLDNPLSDAQKLRDLLMRKYTFDSANIFVLKDPSRQEIYDGFAQIKFHVSDDDNLLIFYAGHGGFQKVANQGYWLPSDGTWENQSTWVMNDEIRIQLRQINAKHILLISDACFSGNMLDLKRGDTDSADASVSEIYKMKSRRAITSGALETVPDNSYFMKYLCNYLGENKDKFILSRKLYLDIRADVTNRSPSHQKPLEGVISETGDEFGDFLFIKRDVITK